jgi:hypothetical protein
MLALHISSVMGCDCCHHSACGHCADFLSCAACGKEISVCQSELRNRDCVNPCGCGDRASVCCDSCLRSSDAGRKQAVIEARKEGQRQEAMAAIRQVAQIFGVTSSDLAEWLGDRATRGPKLVT